MESETPLFAPGTIVEVGDPDLPVNGRRAIVVDPQSRPGLQVPPGYALVGLVGAVPLGIRRLWVVREAALVKREGGGSG